MAGKALGTELAHWLLEPNRHGERVTSQCESADVCVSVSLCVCVRIAWFRKGENGSVIEKVVEVKETEKEEEKVMGLV